MADNKRQLGKEKEELACKYLQELGYNIVTTNFFSQAGEIDIVAGDGKYLCFIEVKYRMGSMSGAAAEAVSAAKQRSICRTSDFYRARYRIPEDRPIRYDVVAIDKDEIRLIKNAFDYTR